MKTVITLSLVLFCHFAISSEFAQRAERFKAASKASVEKTSQPGNYYGTCVTAQVPNLIKQSFLGIEVSEHPLLGTSVTYIDQFNIKNWTTNKNFHDLFKRMRRAGASFYNQVTEGESYLFASRSSHYNSFYGGEVNKKDFYIRESEGILYVYIDEAPQPQGTLTVLCEFDEFKPVDSSDNLE